MSTQHSESLFSLFILFVVKDYPDHAIELKAQHKQQLKTIGFWNSIRHAYINWQTWCTGICANFTNLPTFILGTSLGNLFLVQTQAFSPTQAATISGMIFIGTLIGTPIFGWFSDRIANRKIPIFAGTLLAFLIVLAVIYIPHLSYLSMIVLFLLLGFTTSAGILNYAFVAEKNPSTITATSVSVVSMNVIGIGGSGVNPVCRLAVKPPLGWHPN